MVSAEPSDAAVRERVSRKVARLLVPASTTPAAPFEDASRSEDDRTRSLNCLTAAIYYEARSETEDGQRAVAQVVLNRVRHPAYPSSICGVVFQGSQRRTGCQFSFTCDGSISSRRDFGAWDRARRLATEALSGNVFAQVGNATHYHTTAILPYWAKHLRKSAIVGAHIFYRWAGNAGEASAFRQHHGGLEPAPALWRPAPDAETGVTIHTGTSKRKWREQITLDDGDTVTIHRGAAPRRDAARDSSIDPSEMGVTVHRGTPPVAS